MSGYTKSSLVVVNCKPDSKLKQNHSQLLTWVKLKEKSNLPRVKLETDSLDQILYFCCVRTQKSMRNANHVITKLLFRKSLWK